ncbi:MAG TPA: crossover junction endodeoxyribonuclease RuvC [Kiritimatiellia bacterium]
MRVLGVDTSLRCTGYGVVDARGSSLTAVESGVIKTPASQPHSACLQRLDEGIRDLIKRAHPDVVAVEGIFFCKNVRTAVTLGEARGVVIAACATAGLAVYEYAPRKVKRGVVGHGSAHKSQVGRMIKAMLKLDVEPEEDAADALAIAICHVHSNSRIAALKPEAI